MKEKVNGKTDGLFDDIIFGSNQSTPRINIECGDITHNSSVN